MIGKQRASRVTSGVWSNSSITGRRVSSARRAQPSLKPISASRIPTALELMPTRWNTLIAFGEAYRTRASSSSRIVPSPIRGAALESSSGPSFGNDPSAIITAKRSNIAW